MTLIFKRQMEEHANNIFSICLLLLIKCLFFATNLMIHNHRYIITISHLHNLSNNVPVAIPINLSLFYY
jgi:hypothetical protein